MPKANKHIEVKPSKYKTSLCQYYAKNVECPYGERCVFAHGERELQTEEENIAILKNTGLSRLDRGFSTSNDHVNGDVDNVIKKVAICDEKGANYMEPSFSLSDSDNDLSGSDSNPSSLSSRAEQTVQEYDCLQKQPLEEQYLLEQTTLHERQISHAPVCIKSMLSNKLSGKLLRRRPVMVSLPKFDTTCETGTSPYQSNVDILLRRKSSKIISFTANDDNNGNTDADNNIARAVDTITKERLPSRTCTDTTDLQANRNDAMKVSTESKMEKQLCARSKHVRHGVCTSSWQSSQCACAISATCARDRPTVYRHNPYLICETMQQEQQQEQQQKKNELYN